jgi:2,3-bisphosphoglycerate-dependent phosphoglycerate mutase
MQLYIIRHAQSTNNALTDLRRRVYDPPLTDLGHRQAEVTARHLAVGSDLRGALAPNGRPHGYPITHLYCSAMHRSLQTTAPIAARLDLAPTVWTDIHESGGIYLDSDDGSSVGYPGKTRAEILAEFPNFVLPDAVSDQGWWTGAREEVDASVARAARVAADLRHRQAATDVVAIVSHGDFIDLLLRAIFGQSPQTPMYYYHHNTAISRLAFESHGHVEVSYLNRIEHLPLDLIS